MQEGPERRLTLRYYPQLYREDTYLAASFACQPLSCSIFFFVNAATWRKTVGELLETLRDTPYQVD